ncbi:MAG: serine/threonine-protein kinase [Bacteroidota bacterium]
MHFVLAPGYRLFDEREVQQLDWYDPALYSQLLREGEGLLIHAAKKVMYILNPVMNRFLRGFRQPALVKAVATEIAVEAQCDVELLKETVLDFMDDMQDMGVLILEGEQAKAQEEQHIAQQLRFAAGSRIGNYEVEEIIARKSSVTIYRAYAVTDRQKENPIVIKAQTLDTGLGKKKRKKLKKKYRQEFRLIEEVHDHPGVCAFHEFIEHENALCAVIEYVDGRALKSALRHRKLSLSQKLHILGQFLSVMAHLHRKKVIHGDLHSANLMITPSLQIKLIDFNLSNHAQPHPWEVIRQGGVYQYLPPEKIGTTIHHVVEGRADFRSEVFQMGVMIYLLLYEKMPFSGLRYKELEQAIKTQALQFPKLTPSGEVIPEATLKVLEKALRKQPKKRYRSAVKMQKAYLAKAEKTETLK